MPVQYKDQNIIVSNLHNRSEYSLFDASHLMQTWFNGKDCFKFIKRLVVGDIKGLKPDNGTLTGFTNDIGSIIDDLIVNNTSCEVTSGWPFIITKYFHGLYSE